ncbi:esterase family protein [Gordonia polyisoprenivorans]|uniref:alpha/beta hydrolase n=1 Tax=Gordonia polyisoprenivorans TaxID=84595 RepID=UPI000376C4E1|nr:alpha/beta hydrolase family protein [Gordonia polyisoprenivorans]QUD84715.1 esterase family protein [Gordonia polyisoprenivorans]
MTTRRPGLRRQAPNGTEPHGAGPTASSWARRIGMIAAMLLLAATVGAQVPARAQAAHLVAVHDLSPTESVLEVYSSAMGKVITSQVLHPPGRPAGPAVYMLPGLGGGEDGISWINNGGARAFFAGKTVTAVFPVGGRASMFTDWQRDDPILGRNKWRTFLTRELPPIVNRAFHTNGVNAITGVSMSGGPALAIAESAPGMYRAVASYSGCPGTTDLLGVGAVTAVVTRGGGNMLNMWGPPGGPDWVANDPIVNAGKLRGTAVFLSAATGMPGPIDGGPAETLGGLAGGGQIEAYTRVCTAAMSNRLTALGIAHTFSARPLGSHSWGVFAADLRASWPVIGRAIGA